MYMLRKLNVNGHNFFLMVERNKNTDSTNDSVVSVVFRFKLLKVNNKH